MDKKVRRRVTTHDPKKSHLSEMVGVALPLMAANRARSLVLCDPYVYELYYLINNNK